MMKNKVIITTVIITTLLFSSTPIVANPGGNGDNDRDFTCGGSCHGDPSLSVDSDGIISIEIKEFVYAGTTTEIVVKIDEVTTSNERIVGIFLLGSINGNNDQPADYGWEIIQDENGGTSNYIEKRASINGSVHASWIIRSPTNPGTYNLFASIQHGIDPNPKGLAALGVSEKHEIEILPIPENYPSLSEDWIIPEYREIDGDGTITILTENTDNIEVNWKLSGELNSNIAEIQEIGIGEWRVFLPKTIGDSKIEFQITIFNGNFSVEQPWMEIGTENERFEGSSIGARLQALSYAIIIFGFVLSMQSWLVSTDFSDYFSKVRSKSHESENNDSQRMIFHEKYPGWLWDSVEEKWVPDIVESEIRSED
ncbi:MAG: hypothetical protein CL993_02225 [Euryarchaeota archaeon]|nr:hypothetical protein [Euryarchaeota archaeon]|tara:strand:+ start:1273 stop:2376 length:1104 start_codon:yes stop_codon:yes gene_type:complete